MAIEEDVLRRVSPTAGQRSKVDEATNDLLQRVKEEAHKTGLALKVTIQGSVAKGTYTYPPDIDIFILFPEPTSRKDLERLGLKIGKGVLRGEERYAEHPYMHGVFKGFEADIVPCFAISSPAGLKSAVDRTPFHTEYVLSKLTEAQRAEVRLLKQFMRGIGVYGAEAKVQGFSGYLVELLVLRYGDFRSVLGAVRGWRKGQVASFERGSKFDSPLVFHDPVDPTRNVASAVSIDSMSLFIHAANSYLGRPSIRFFFPRERKTWPIARIRSELRRRGTKLLTVALPRPDLIDDDLHPQLRKTLNGLRAVLEQGDLPVCCSSYHVEGKKVVLVFELAFEKLPASYLHQGPPAWMGTASDFLGKWSGKAISGPYLEQGRWVAVVRRRYITAADLVKKEARRAALGSSFKTLKGMKVLDTEGSLRSEYREALTAHLDKTLPWQR
ncbi:MAG: CCA tRNA nucleotidyltransferase [Methanomassiliicoccales archaeon]|nr:CCA tRNA nucleotidyltransferase [Methanomassiliicoccales archaeon]